jgi:hypothetical protein
MKKLKDLNIHVIEDNNALTIKGGDCDGEEIDWLLYNNAQFDFFSRKDFYDSGNDWSM